MNNLSHIIKRSAISLGFETCGICRAEMVTDKEKECFENWLRQSYQADMAYMCNYQDIRLNPTLLVENAKSVICVALNYYPAKKQPISNPQIAYYAYGNDYHDVVKQKLHQLLYDIKAIDPTINGRVFCDTAPLLERYWAAKSGLGFIGKNSMLIIPQKGSFFFLGEIVIDKTLEYDSPIEVSCGNCTKCMDACPTKAIKNPYIIDSNKCISYQTIENRNVINPQIIPSLNNCVYGCDICQNICPWNRFATPNQNIEFNPSDDLLNLDYERLKNLTEEEYIQIFKRSAVKRVKYKGLKRNIEALDLSRKK